MNTGVGDTGIVSYACMHTHTFRGINNAAMHEEGWVIAVMFDQEGKNLVKTSYYQSSIHCCDLLKKPP